MHANDPSRRSLRAPGAQPAESGRSVRRRRGWLFWGVIGLAALLVLSVVWIGLRGLMAKSELEAALPLVSDIRTDLSGGDFGAAQKSVDTVAEHTGAARSLTSDIVWRAAEVLPGIGVNLTSMRQLAEVVDDTVVGAVQPLASLGDLIDPATLSPAAGAIDTQPFVDAVPMVQNASVVVQGALETTRGIDTSQTVGQLRDAVEKLDGILEPMVPVLDQAALAIAALPGALGAEGARNYLVVFQNNAEARALGGHPGSLALINVDQGKVSLVQQSSVKYDIVHPADPVIPIPADVEALWEPGARNDPANMTMIPNLQIAADTAKEFWRLTYGTDVDAVVFMDTVALAHMLDATGDITTSDGDVLNAQNAAQFLLNTIYIRYEENDPQDAVFNSVTDQVFAKISNGDFDAGKLLGSALESGEEHRLLVWSFREDERAALADAPFTLKPLLNDDKTATFGVYVADHLGSKMTYYMEESIQLAQAQCAAGGSQYRVTVTVRNDLDPAIRNDLPGRLTGGDRGHLRVIVTLYAPPGATITGVENANPEYTPIAGYDGDHAALRAELYISAGETDEMTYTVSAPNVDKRDLKAMTTPLFDNVDVEQVDGTFTC